MAKSESQPETFTAVSLVPATVLLTSSANDRLNTVVEGGATVTLHRRFLADAQRHAESGMLRIEVER